MDRRFYLAVAVILVSFSFVFFGLSHISDINGGSSVCFNGRCFGVEVASTSAERAEGLMNRDSLDRGRGMLFVFGSEGIRGFWMKNVRFPLDMVFMDGDGKITEIKRNAEPCSESCPSITPGEEFSYVLEINGGLSEEMGLENGDRAEIFMELV